MHGSCSFCGNTTHTVKYCNDPSIIDEFERLRSSPDIETLLPRYSCAFLRRFHNYMAVNRVVQNPEPRRPRLRPANSVAPIVTRPAVRPIVTPVSRPAVRPATERIAVEFQFDNIVYTLNNIEDIRAMNINDLLDFFMELQESKKDTRKSIRLLEKDIRGLNISNVSREYDLQISKIMSSKVIIFDINIMIQAKTDHINRLNKEKNQMTDELNMLYIELRETDILFDFVSECVRTRYSEMGYTDLCNINVAAKRSWKVITKKDTNISTLEDDCCPICYDSNDGKIIRTECNHCFCSKCVWKHFECSDKTTSPPICPMCRTTISEIYTNDNETIEYFNSFWGMIL